MSKESENRINRLGYKDMEEMLLYQDVCGGEAPEKQPEDFNELLELLESEEDSFNGYRKQTYEKYINDAKLLELFNKVKDMTLLDRFLEIYIYYSNQYYLSMIALKNMESKIQHAQELFDGEKEMEYKRQFFNIRYEEERYSRCCNYIERQAFERLSDSEKSSYLEKTKNINDTFFIIDDFKKGRGTK